MITQTINLNLIPGAVPPRVNVTQYDEGSRTIVANLYNGTSTFTPSAGTTAKVKGTKPDKHGFEYDATISGRTVEIDLTQQMSCVAGDVLCEVELALGDEVLGTGTFVLRVKASALADDTDISETVLPDIIDAAQSSAASAAASAEAAQEAANSVSVEYTATGNPISVSAFPTEATTSMTIAPTQNLHGYDKPWAGGAGVNKFDIDSATMVGTVGVFGLTVSKDSDGYIVISGTYIGTSDVPKFAIIPTLAVIDNAVFYCMDKNGDAETNIIRCRWGNATTGGVAIDLQNMVQNQTYNIKFRLMIVTDGTTPTTFSPYSNVCPITGITTATVQTTDGETTNTASMELGETVFGGSVNFNAGTGTVTYGISTFDGTESWSDSVTANCYSVAKPATMPAQYFSALSNMGVGQSSTSEGSIYSGNSYLNVALASTFSTVEAFKAYLAEHPLQVVYELATPTTLSLTPDTLTMLNGEQTVSGNGETVTLTYDGNVKQYIDTKVPDAPTTDGTYTLTCVVSGGVPTYSWT